jgi:hypothetical protein
MADQHADACDDAQTPDDHPRVVDDRQHVLDDARPLANPDGADQDKKGSYHTPGYDH